MASQLVPPDLSGQRLPWQSASYWRPGEFDPEALLDALRAQPDLSDYFDEVGNPQCRARLDSAEGGNAGYWITIPADAPESALDAGLAAYEPPHSPPPKPPVQERVALVLAKIQADNGTNAVTVDQLAEVVAALTG